MSFFFDLPALFVLGVALYYVGKSFEMERLAKITVGSLIILCFLIGGALLYADVFRVPQVPPIIQNTTSIGSNYLSGSDFMFRWPLDLFTEVPDWFTKAKIPSLVVVFLFILYPIFFYSGYASALLYSKGRRKISNKSKSYKDVRSTRKIVKAMKYSIVRYPDTHNNIDNLEEAVAEAVKKLGGMESFVHQNDKVLIKVNICGGDPNNSATFTNKEIVGYVVDMVRKAGGDSIIVCDADMVWTAFWPVAKAEGWDKWAIQKNVKLTNLSETELVYFDFGEGSVFEHNEHPNKELVSREMLGADVIINIPVMKTHLFTSVTLGMKNMYGTYPEMDKARFHKTGLVDVIYYVNSAFPPTLTIVDGSIGGEGIGPLVAKSVNYNTIVASNNVVVADAIASKLIGFKDPFNEIEHLRITKEKEESKPEDKRRLLRCIPKYLNESVEGLLTAQKLQMIPKDGNWDRADQESVDENENLLNNLLEIPYFDTLTNIGADFILFDAARLPYIKHIQSAILNILYSPRFWAEKKDETMENKQRKDINLFIFGILALLSLIFFVAPSGWNIEHGYLWQASQDWNLSQWILLGLAAAIIFGAWFARRMKTNHLIAITLSSIFVAYLAESFGPWANWWIYKLEVHYPLNNSYAQGIAIGAVHTPIFPLFVIPIFIISVIGFSYFLSRMFKYVNLTRSELKLLPFLLVIIVMPLFLYSENYLDDRYWPITWPIIYIYIAFAGLGLYFNAKQTLEWNLAIVIVAVVLGGLVEKLGAMPGFWVYPDPTPALAINLTPINMTILNAIKTNTTLLNSTLIALNAKSELHTLPLFISFTWVLNAWAVCGIAMIVGDILGVRLDLSKSFVDSDRVFDEKDPQVYIRRGNEYASKKKYKEAIESFNKALNLDSDLAEAWNGKGDAFAGLGWFKKSLEAYETALRKDPHYAEALYHEAGMLLNLSMRNENKKANTKEEDVQAKKEAAEQRKKAMEAYDKAIRLNPTDINISIDKALALQQQGKFDDSIKTYNKAIQDIVCTKKADLDRASKIQSEAKLWTFIGFANLDQGDIEEHGISRYDEAIKFFDKIIKIKPDRYVIDTDWLAGAWWGKGYALAKKAAYEETLNAKIQKYKDALEAFDKLAPYLDMSPPEIPDMAALSWSDKGDILVDQGKCLKALSKMRGVQEAAAKIEEMAKKNYKDALDSYKKAIDRCPEPSILLKAHALNREEDALDKLNIHAWKGEKGALYRFIVHAMKGNGDAIDALDPDNKNYKGYKIYMESIDKLEKFIHINGKDADALSSRGNIFHKIGLYDDALKDYDKAIKCAPPSLPYVKAKALTGRGDVLTEIGDKEMALSAYIAATHIDKDYLPAWHGIDHLSGIFSEQSTKNGIPTIVIPGHISARNVDPRYAEAWQRKVLSLHVISE